MNHGIDSISFGNQINITGDLVSISKAVPILIPININIISMTITHGVM